MTTVVTLPAHRTDRQRRLRVGVKRLVLELGYLEQCLGEGLQDRNVRQAAQGLERVIRLFE